MFVKLDLNYKLKLKYKSKPSLRPQSPAQHSPTHFFSLSFLSSSLSFTGPRPSLLSVAARSSLSLLPSSLPPMPGTHSPANSPFFLLTPPLSRARASVATHAVRVTRGPRVTPSRGELPLPHQLRPTTSALTPLSTLTTPSPPPDVANRLSSTDRRSSFPKTLPTTPSPLYKPHLSALSPHHLLGEFPLLPSRRRRHQFWERREEEEKWEREEGEKRRRSPQRRRRRCREEDPQGGAASSGNTAKPPPRRSSPASRTLTSSTPSMLPPACD